MLGPGRRDAKDGLNDHPPRNFPPGPRKDPNPPPELLRLLVAGLAVAETAGLIL